MRSFRTRCLRLLTSSKSSCLDITLVDFSWYNMSIFGVFCILVLVHNDTSTFWVLELTSGWIMEYLSSVQCWSFTIMSLYKSVLSMYFSLYFCPHFSVTTAYTSVTNYSACNPIMALISFADLCSHQNSFFWFVNKRHAYYRLW